MDDFIKRSDALKVIETANSMVSRLLEATMKLCVTMNSIAAADVAPVVRCKNCEYWDRETIRQNSNDAGWWNEAICKEHTIYGNEHHDAWTSADWFCADGERKDGPGAYGYVDAIQIDTAPTIIPAEEGET